MSPKLDATAPPSIWSSHLWNPEWFRRKEGELGCGEQFTLYDPELILGEQRSLLDAGVDAISTNTFGATTSVMKQYSENPQAWKVNKESAVLAKRAASEFSPERSRLVLGSVGPTTRPLSLIGKTDKRDIAELRENYDDQIDGLMEGGVDILHLEKCHDCLNAQTALEVLQDVQEKRGRRIPIVVSAAIESTGRMLDGSTASDLWQLSRNFAPFKFGISGNSTNLGHALTQLAIENDVSIVVFMNTLSIGGGTESLESPESFVSQLTDIFQSHLPSIIGFGPGTRPIFVRKVIDLLRGP